MNIKPNNCNSSYRIANTSFATQPTAGFRGPRPTAGFRFPQPTAGFRFPQPTAGYRGPRPTAVRYLP